MPTATETTFGDRGAGGYVLGAAGPTVILTTAIAGVNDYVIRQAARLTGKGYTCVVLDYYARQGGQAPDLSSPEKIMKAVAELSDPQVLDDLEAALDWAKDRSGGGPVGALGFCIGGAYALLAAAQLPGLSCAITFYGTLRYPTPHPGKPLSPLDAADKATCPVLGHFGEADHLIPLDDARELAERLKGKPAEIYTYPGAGHAFHEDFRPEIYRPVAATTAWARTQEYLSCYLRPDG
ncbi:alpha/beta fold hydrolase [Nonomuraea sp. B5E05]|uniref:dienelactone hydrolase family protein n=1 Tax=Nonomuraea sp. B5E05 TaxID=3153569 RepID=UPI0032618FE8